MYGNKLMQWALNRGCDVARRGKEGMTALPRE